MTRRPGGDRKARVADQVGAISGAREFRVTVDQRIDLWSAQEPLSLPTPSLTRQGEGAGEGPEPSTKGAGEPDNAGI